RLVDPRKIARRCLRPFRPDVSTVQTHPSVYLHTLLGRPCERCRSGFSDLANVDWVGFKIPIRVVSADDRNSHSRYISDSSGIECLQRDAELGAHILDVIPWV